MIFTHYHQFEELNDSVALVIEYDYEPAEKQVLNPIEDAHEGCAENAVISSVQLSIHDESLPIKFLISESLEEELVEACLENHRECE
jgi:hypothetical protein